LGIGDWGLGIGPNPQSPIPNPQLIINYNYLKQYNKYLLYKILILKMMIDVMKI